LVISLLFISVALLPFGLPAAGWLWESLNGLGLAAMVLFVVLAFEAQTPSPPLALRQHQALAILATVLVALHALGFLLADPILLEHLKPSAPWSMLSALLALLLLLILCVASFPRWRRYVWPRFAVFRRWHLGLSLLTIGLMLWHLLGTASVFAETWRAASLVALMAGIPLVAVMIRGRGGVPVMVRDMESPADPIRAAIRIGCACLLFAVFYGGLKQP